MTGLNIPGAAEFDSAHVAVVGLGISGTAVAGVLKERTNARVSLWDSSKQSIESAQADLGGGIEARCLSNETMAETLVAERPDIVVIAPGIPATGPVHTALRASGIATWSEIELAWRLRAHSESGEYAPWLAVTGTNGKTTTVTMAAAMLTEGGDRAPAVGNVGDPAIVAATRTDAEAPTALALELSSFQLHSTHSMSALAAGCLNIDDDHLDWHGSREAYAADKARIYQNAQLACLYPVGADRVQAMVDDADVREGARAIGLTMGIPAVGQIGIVDSAVCERAFGSSRWTSAQVLFELDDVAHLSGGQPAAHIVADAMMAAGLARARGTEPAAIQRALQEFNPGAHRIETVSTARGATWIDDSKATNAHAARASLLAQPDHSVIWIAGGQAKGARFEGLVADVVNKLAGVVVIGTDQTEIREALDVAAPGVPVATVSPSSTKVMEEAVALAARFVNAGDVVLLAPACASKDQFDSYAHRGDDFAAAARAME